MYLVTNITCFLLCCALCSLLLYFVISVYYNHVLLHAVICVFRSQKLYIDLTLF